MPDSPVREACQADKPAGNLAQVVPVLVLAADPVAVADPVAAAVTGKEADRVLAVDPVEVAVEVAAVAAAAVAVAEAVFH